MAYDEGLAHRVGEILGDLPGLVEKKMFGGVGFMLHGNMACGIHKENLIVRVGPEKYETALNSPHTRPFDITGKPMKGWVKEKYGLRSLDYLIQESNQKILEYEMRQGGGEALPISITPKRSWPMSLPPLKKFLQAKNSKYSWRHLPAGEVSHEFK